MILNSSLSLSYCNYNMQISLWVSNINDTLFVSPINALFLLCHCAQSTNNNSAAYKPLQTESHLKIT